MLSWSSLKLRLLFIPSSLKEILKPAKKESAISEESLDRSLAASEIDESASGKFSWTYEPKEWLETVISISSALTEEPLAFDIELVIDLLMISKQGVLKARGTSLNARK